MNRAQEIQKRLSQLLLIESELKKEARANARTSKSSEGIITDDEDEENSYHAWRLRELARYNRDKKEEEMQLKEKEEIEKKQRDGKPLDQDTTKFDSTWASGKHLELCKTKKGGIKKSKSKRLRVK